MKNETATKELLRKIAIGTCTIVLPVTLLASCTPTSVNSVSTQSSTPSISQTKSSSSSAVENSNSQSSSSSTSSSTSSTSKRNILVYDIDSTIYNGEAKAIVDSLKTIEENLETAGKVEAYAEARENIDFTVLQNIIESYEFGSSELVSGNKTSYPSTFRYMIDGQRVYEGYRYITGESSYRYIYLPGGDEPICVHWNGGDSYSRYYLHNGEVIAKTKGNSSGHIDPLTIYTGDEPEKTESQDFVSNSISEIYELVETDVDPIEISEDTIEKEK